MRAVLLIENPNEELEIRLSQPDIRPTPIPRSFWECHGVGLQLEGESLWDSVFYRLDTVNLRDEGHDVYSIGGVFECPAGASLEPDPNDARWERSQINSERYGLTLGTRITYGWFGHMCACIGLYAVVFMC